MGQRYVCTFRHAQRAAYRTAISAAQILVFEHVLILFVKNYQNYSVLVETIQLAKLARFLRHSVQESYVRIIISSRLWTVAGCISEIIAHGGDFSAAETT